MNEEYVRESLAKRGVVVAEGMNEVLRFETLGVAAVGLGSNRATAAQVDKLVKFARRAGGNRIVLMPDCDEEGESAFKELLWQLSEAGVDVKLGAAAACSTVDSPGGNLKTLPRMSGRKSTAASKGRSQVVGRRHVASFECDSKRCCRLDVQLSVPEAKGLQERQLLRAAAEKTE